MERLKLLKRPFENSKLKTEINKKKIIVLLQNGKTQIAKENVLLFFLYLDGKAVQKLTFWISFFNFSCHGKRDT